MVSQGMIIKDPSINALEERVKELEKELQDHKMQLSAFKGIDSDLTRYTRQMIVPGIGQQGQDKLTKAKVVVVGAGGLGCAALLYLTAAGVGTIGIVDGDVVEISNLHRQILYTESQCGLLKVDAAESQLKIRNSNTTIVKFPSRLDTSNYETILDQFDLVLDCTDTQMTRYLISDSCVLLNKPMIWSAALKFEGQVCLFNYQKSPCYRCLFPIPTPDFAVSVCNEAGILGPVVGLGGTIQAALAIRVLVLELSDQMYTEMIYYNFSTNLAIKKLNLRGRRKECFACGENKTLNRSNFKQLINDLSNIDIKHVSWSEIKNDIRNCILIDVRPFEDFENYSVPGAINLPFENLDRFSELNLQPQSNVYVYCKMGMTSKKAVQLLAKNIDYNFINIDGGINCLINNS